VQGWSDAGIKGGLGKRDPKGKKTLDKKTVTSTLGTMADTFSSNLVYSITRLGLKSKRERDATRSSTIDLKAVAPCNSIYPSESSTFLDLMSKTIRLIEVLPGTGPDMISCKLHLLKLQDSSPPYTALCYMWGNSEFTRQISINGEMLKVGENLWQWLRQTRELSNLELFWIDAICINQDNITERNHQLPLVKDIYSKV
jgi:hypothetical protein